MDSASVKQAPFRLLIADRCVCDVSAANVLRPKTTTAKYPQLGVANAGDLRERACRARSRVVGEKTTSPVDKHVGSRVRMRRLMLAMSQEKLGNALGLSFQQVQKYEKGMNRIGASRLQQIGEVLQVPVSFFFEDTSASAPHGPDYFQAQIAEFVSSPEGLRFIAAFERIKSPALRREIVSFVKTIGSDARWSRLDN